MRHFAKRLRWLVKPVALWLIVLTVLASWVAAGWYLVLHPPIQ